MSSNKITVLMYHGFDSAEEPSEFTDKGFLLYVVDIKDFEKQISYLVQQEHPIVTLQSADTFDSVENSSRNSIMLTFDDGHISNYLLALPVMKKFNIKGCFFITTDWIDTPNYMTSKMIKSLYDNGMCIGSHGKTHKLISDLSDEEMEHEINVSKSILEEIISDKVTAFSAPGGRIDSRVDCCVKKAGYSYVFNSEPSNADFSIPETILGRFAITRGGDFSAYKKLVSGRLPAMSLLRYKILLIMKRLLGNTFYDKLRYIANKAFDRFSTS